jgi:hypothetical protein
LPYQIVGLLEGSVRYTEGVDAAQAIYLAMEAIGTTLAATPARAQAGSPGTERLALVSRCARSARSSGWSPN